MRQVQFDDDEPYVIIEKESGHLPSFFWGLAIGAGVALLFAPKSGAQTRRDIKRRAVRASDAAREAAEELSDSVMDRYESARRGVEERLSSARRAIELKRDQASRALRAGREAAQEAREELERRIAETKVAYQGGADEARESRADARQGRATVAKRGGAAGGGASAAIPASGAVGSSAADTGPGTTGAGKLGTAGGA